LRKLIASSSGASSAIVSGPMSTPYAGTPLSIRSVSKAAKPVALGYVRREHVAPGTRVEVHAAAGILAATVQPAPSGA